MEWWGRRLSGLGIGLMAVMAMVLIFSCFQMDGGGVGGCLVVKRWRGVVVDYGPLLISVDVFG